MLSITDAVKIETKKYLSGTVIYYIFNCLQENCNNTFKTTFSKLKNQTITGFCFKCSRKYRKVSINRQPSLKKTSYGLKGPRFQDLKNKQFDNLLVIDYVGHNKKYKISKWLCKCKCGKEVIRQTDVLLRKKRQHNCGCISPIPVKPNQQYAFNILFASYKQNAKKRGYQFTLLQNEFRELIIQNCYYCNQPPTIRYKNQAVDPILANGVDRKDNTKHYTILNCVPCCKICNMAKGQLTVDEFVVWIKNIYTNLVSYKNV